MKELVQIQAKLKAPKSQRNNFGKYNYRSCEDILEAVKPLCNERDCVLLLSDSVKEIGDRHYVVAQAMLINSESNNMTAYGYAREADSKKGMDASQLTGATSSYARKYALNGLFAIDDTKDADATNDHSDKSKAPSKPKVVSDTNACKQINACKTMAELQKAWTGLTPSERGLPKVIEAKDNMKAKIGQA